MMYVYIGGAVVILFLVWQIIRWWNLPKIAEERRKKIEVRQKEHTARVRLRKEARERRRRQAIIKVVE